MSGPADSLVPPGGRLGAADRRALSLLFLFLLILTALTWRRWGDPAFDAGNELAVADLVAGGAEPYGDVRYYYGPAGLYALALAFKLFGASLTTAWALGFLQALAILGVFYALARAWLSALPAALATAVLCAIGFSGSIFNFVLPHSNSATFGLLFLLACLLCLAHDRLAPAGVAAGVVLLTRPEFALFAAGALVAAGAGRWRVEGRGAAVRQVALPAVVAVAVAGPVLAYFAARVGAGVLFTESLFPLDFIDVSGKTFARTRAPFTVESLFATALRGAVYAALLAGFVLGFERLRRREGLARLSALGPPAGAVAALLALDGLSRASGLLTGVRVAVEDDCTRLLIAMSWLPALAAAAVVWGALRLRRGGAPPLGRSWPADLALLAAAGLCALRTYDDFTTDVASVYYAAAPLLVAAIAHERLGHRRPAARPALLAALGVIAVALAGQGYLGRYRDHSVEIASARGSYLAAVPAAPQVRATLAEIARRTRPGTPILVLPDDGGLHFLSDRPPALRDLTYLPGSLYPVARERGAIAGRRRGRPPLVVVGARHFDAYGFEGVGVDYNRELIAFVTSAYEPVATFGDFDDPPRTATPSEAFRVYALRGAR